MATELTTVLFGVELEFLATPLYHPTSGPLRNLCAAGLLSCGTDPSVASTDDYTVYGYEWRIGVMQANWDGAKWDYPLFAQTLDLVLAYVKPYNAHTNRTCGLHVHVSSLDGHIDLDIAKRNALLTTSRWWKSRSKYVSNTANLEDHISGIGVRYGMNHLEFRWPNGTIKRRGVHETVQRCLNQYKLLWRP